MKPKKMTQAQYEGYVRMRQTPNWLQAATVLRTRREDKTWEECGRVVGVSRERARQIAIRAMQYIALGVPELAEFAPLSEGEKQTIAKYRLPRTPSRPVT